MSNQLGEVRIIVTVRTNNTQQEVIQTVMGAVDARYGFQNTMWETTQKRQDKKCADH